MVRDQPQQPWHKQLEDRCIAEAQELPHRAAAKLARPHKTGWCVTTVPGFAPLRNCAGRQLWSHTRRMPTASGFASLRNCAGRQLWAYVRDHGLRDCLL